METIKHSLDLLKDTYNYNHWIYSHLRPYLGESVLEVGSGTGNITRFLLSCPRVVCLEPEPVYIKLLSDLANRHLNVQLVVSSLEEFSAGDLSPGKVDTVICINVLEHIEDDESAVRKMLSLLQPGGKLLLYVPACQWAFGAMDEAMGHHRRYSRRDINTLARKAGTRVCVRRFVNFVGLAGWWWAGCILRETQIDVRKARFMDRIVPFLSSVERLVSPPIGQSLFAVLQQEQRDDSRWQE